MGHADPKKFLALTADRRFWRRAEHTVFLGEWCLPGLNADEKSTECYSVLPSPWNIERDIDRVGRYLNAFQESLLAHLAGRLNDIHRVDFDIRDWRILMGSWILHAVHTLFDRFHLLERARAVDEGLTTWIPTHTDAAIPPTTNSFQYAQLYSDTSLLLLGRLIEAMNIPHEAVASPAIAIGNSIYYRSVGTGRLKALARQTISAWRAIQARRAEVMFFECSIRPSQLKAFGIEKIARREAGSWHPGQRNPVDMTSRKKLFEGICAEDSFQELSSRVLPYLFPASHLEDFVLWRRKAESDRWLPKARKVISVYGFGGNDLSAHYLVRLRRRGARLVGMQHGGGYGSYRYCPEELHESRCSDNYVNWGWSSEPPFIPLPSLHLLTFEREARVRSGRRDERSILLVVSDRPNLTHRIMSHPMSGQVSRYFAWQARFYEALPPGAKKTFSIKPFVDDYMSVGSKWWSKLPIRTVDGPLKRVARQHGLLVFDHNGTGYLEALSANLPTVIFWDSELWELREDAVAYFAQLKSAGIFHDTAESAAAHVGQVIDSVSDWWHEARTQRARAAFCDRFARTGENWRQEWRCMLLSSD